MAHEPRVLHGMGTFTRRTFKIPWNPARWYWESGSFIDLCREEAPRSGREGGEGPGKQRSLGLPQDAWESAQEESGAHSPQARPDGRFLPFPPQRAGPHAPASPHVTGNVFMKY